MSKPLLLASLLFIGCVDAPDATDDPIDSSFLTDGKDDAFGIADGSPDAVGVLSLANTADEATLRAAGLGPKATAHLLADRPISDLAALDAVPYIGATAFAHLLAYARAHGYVVTSVFDPSSCTGPTISQSELQTLTANGTKPLPHGATWKRYRSCSQALGCSAWSAPAQQGTPEQSTGSYSTYANYVDLYLQANYISDAGGQAWNIKIDWNAQLAIDTGKIIPTTGGDGDQYVNDTYTFDTMTVTFTDHCLRAYGDFIPDHSASPWTEYQDVWLATF